MFAIVGESVVSSIASTVGTVESNWYEYSYRYMYMYYVNHVLCHTQAIAHAVEYEGCLLRIFCVPVGSD